MSYKFIVSVEGVGKLATSKISGLETENEVVEYREGDDPTYMRKLPGLVSFNTVSLEHGVTPQASQFLEWRRMVAEECDLKEARKTVLIHVNNCEGKLIRTYTLRRAWPSKLSFADLDASSSEVYIETLELSYEGFSVKLANQNDEI